MALARSKVLAALFFLVVVAALLLVLLLDHHGSSRLRAAAVLLDRLRGVDVDLGLATSRKMVLLCHAILLLVLRDAGLLGTTTARRRRHSANDAVVACFYSPPERSPARRAVVWRPRNTSRAKNTAADEIGRLKRQRRGARPVVAVEGPPAAPPSLTEQEQGAQHEPANTEEIILVEEPRTSLDDDHSLVTRGLEEPAAADCKTTIPSQLDFVGSAAVAHDEGNIAVAEEDTAEEGELQHEYGQEEDLDEMNRRFEAFIADTKKKMLLEALQPVHVSLSAY